MTEGLEEFWKEVLSRDPERVRTAIASLKDTDEKLAIIAHLQKMATEPGWSEPQKVSAKKALEALEASD